MNEDFVTYDIAKKLKEKGFKEECLAYYTNDNTLYYNFSHKVGACCIDCLLSHNLMPKDSVSGKFIDAPTISQALKWLLEKHDYYIAVNVDDYGWRFDIVKIPLSVMCCQTLENISRYPSYEHAALAGIEYAVDNLIK